jgi:hypothetical protein
MGERRRRDDDQGRRTEVLPRARREAVLSTDLGDEVVVYDSKEHRGHCLNRPAALVWRRLDGQTSMDDLVTDLRKEVDGLADEETVRLALDELDRAQLLEGRLDPPASPEASRRSALRRIGVAAGSGALLLPAISSILAPPVHAQISAVPCPTPEPGCATFSCAGGCACVTTTEGATLCITPSCVGPCTTSADCPAGSVCFTLGCCGPATFCVPLCGAPLPDPGRRWQAP